MPLLIKYNDNYADEFDINGFQIMEETEWNTYVAKVRLCTNWPQSRWFGTNEGVQWPSAQEHLQNFEVIEITEEEATPLYKNFIGGAFGYFLQIDRFDEPNTLY